jgi:PAS domain S-box-containing protein
MGYDKIVDEKGQKSYVSGFSMRDLDQQLAELEIILQNLSNDSRPGKSAVKSDATLSHAKQLASKCRTSYKHLLESLPEAQNQAKAELRARDELLRMAVSVAPILLFLIDREGYLRLSMGKHIAREKDDESIIGRSVYEIYGDNAKVIANFERALTGIAFQDVIEIDGHYFLVYYEPVRNSSGQISGVIGTSLDITDNKRLQDELLERIKELSKVEEDLLIRVEERKRVLELLSDSERRFQLLVQSIKEYAIFSFNPDGYVTTWNAGAEAIKGYNTEEVLGKHISYFYPPEDREAGVPQKALETARKQGRCEEEGWRVRKDGNRFWANSTIYALYDKQGNLQGYSKVVRDMTVRKKAEETLNKQSILLKMLQDMTVAANAARHMQDAVQFALQSICQYTGWQIGLAYEVLPEPPRTISLISSHVPEKDPAFTKLVEASQSMQFKRGEGVPGQVLSSGQYIWSSDLSIDSRLTTQQEENGAQIKMVAAFPVKIGPEVTHILEFLATRTSSPDADLLEMIAHLATQLGRVAERERSEEALRRSEMRFRTIFQSAALGIELVDLNGRLMAFNPSICRIFGYEEEELLESALGKSDHPVIITYLDEKFKGLQAGKLDHYTLERVYQHRSGNEIWGVSTVSLVRDTNWAPQYAICMLTDETEMREMHRRLAVGKEEERLFLARELHDGPIQDLYGLSYTMRAFVDRMPPGVVKEPVEEIQKSLQKVVQTLRHISSELRPPALAPFGLEKAIRSHAQQFRESHPEIRLRLDLFPDGQRLPTNVRMVLFRIYQASLANILRHAHARHVDILLEMDEEQVHLEIRDDGDGFVVPERWIQMARDGHLGIVGAIERAESIGGTLQIQSAPGKGTRVSVVAPLNTML